MGLVGDAQHCGTLMWLHPGLLDKECGDRDLVFHFARAFCLLRPEHLLYLTTGSATVLRAAALASLKLVQPAARVSGDVDEIERLAAVLRTDLAPASIEMLGRRADELRAAVAGDAVEQWMAGAGLSGSRLALVLCDDLETAARLEVDPRTPVKEQALQPKQRLAELFAYAVSEEYFAVRKALGLATGCSATG